MQEALLPLVPLVSSSSFAPRRSTSQADMSHYHAGHGSEVSAQRYFGVFGWLPQHLAADEPKVSKAIAKARALAEKDCEAHADSMGATTSLELRSWPTPPSHCTRMSHRGAEPRERQRVSLSGLRRTHSRDLYEGKEELR